MTLLWTMIAIWLCFATLLPIYVLFKAMFPPGSPTPNAYPHGSCAASKRGMGGVMITVAADLNASKQRMKSRHHCCAGISTGAAELVIEGRCGDRMVIKTSFLVTMGAQPVAAALGYAVIRAAVAYYSPPVSRPAATARKRPLMYKLFVIAAAPLAGNPGRRSSSSAPTR
jgi:hypothetical protein